MTDKKMERLPGSVSSTSGKVERYGFVLTQKLIQIAGFDCTLRPAARRILNIIAGYADKDGVCFPSIKKISKKLGMTSPAISKQLRILENHEYLTRVSRSNPDSGATQSNIYMLNHGVARTFGDTPEIFCEFNHELIMGFLFTWYMLDHQTSKGNPPDNSHGLVGELPQVLNGGTTQTSNPKIKKEEKNKRKIEKDNITAKKSLALKKANGWRQGKEFEAKTGIIDADSYNYNQVIGKLRKYMKSHALTVFDLEINRTYKHLHPKQAFDKKLEAFNEKLRQFEGK